MKTPRIARFMSTDEWRASAQRGHLGGLRKLARFVSLLASPAAEGDPNSRDWFDLTFELPDVPDRFGDWYGTGVVKSGILIGFGFDPELEGFISTGFEQTPLGITLTFRAHQPSQFWRPVIGLALAGALERMEVGVLPGAYKPVADGHIFQQPEILCVQFLPPMGTELAAPGMEPIRDWVQRIAAGQPEKTERYEIVAECLRDLPAPPPEADPDQVLLEAMRELTTALKENTRELRCLQGKTE